MSEYGNRLANAFKATGMRGGIDARGKPTNNREPR
jgi:hypothetical protein